MNGLTDRKETDNREMATQNNDHENSSQSGRKKNGILLNLILAVCVLVFLGCGCYLGVYFFTSRQAESAFAEIKLEVEQDNCTEETGKPVYTTVQEKKVYKKYASVYEENTDFVGWLYIYGTRIDYPVMYTPENEEYYIHRNFQGGYSAAGTLFAAANCSPTGKVSDNVIIYGHNMKAGTMFHDLLKYEDEDFYKEHQTIIFDTLDGLGTYIVIAAFYTKAYPEGDTEHYNIYDFADAGSKEKFDDYVSRVKANTPYTIEETASYGDKLLTLSTCAYHTEDGRFVVVAKKIGNNSRLQ